MKARTVALCFLAVSACNASRATLTNSAGETAPDAAVGPISSETGGSETDASNPATNEPVTSEPVDTSDPVDVTTGSETPGESMTDNVEADGPDLAPGPAISMRPPATPYLGLPAQAQVAPSGWQLVEAFPALDFDHPVFLAPAPKGGKLFVSEQGGRLYTFDNDPAVSEKTLVLDLAAVTQGGNDAGLLGFAFHPDFGKAGSDNAQYLFIHYAYTDSLEVPAAGERATSTHPTFSRLARFNLDLESWVADPNSELLLIDQYDQNLWHQGGGMFFHPEDGFLYLSVGDEGSLDCYYQNCQRIDRDLFSGVLRIDVNQRGGDISHPIPKQPDSGVTANYYIPNDNPFVGVPDALEEFYALGLRSPHRMTYDTVDGLTWIGDVGEETHEEINILARGANFQWHAREGFDPYPNWTSGDPADPLGIWTEPLLDFERKDSRAIIGGYVYRGERLPQLRGKYIYGDYVYGNIRALSYAKEGANVSVLDNELLVQTELRGFDGGITSFGVDEHGELYVLGYGPASKIRRLTQQQESSSNAPRLLSQTGVFADVRNLTPSPSLLPYDVNTPLWSDGANKRRWLAVPDGTQIEFSPEQPWRFPEGTVFVKHFEIALDEREPEQRTRLETRVLVAAGDGGYYGLSYRWREDDTDAELLFESEVQELSLTDASGKKTPLRYFYPGPGDCLVCHNASAGRVLGVRTAQLNHEYFYPETAVHQNQLDVWQELGLLAGFDTAAPLDTYPQLAALDDKTRSLTDRVRSYWDANCSMCHGVQNDIRAKWDARFSTPLEGQGVVNATLEGGGATETRIVVPGQPDLSELFLRDSTTDPNRRMPPLGRSRADDAYLTVLEAWIAELGP